MNTARPLQPALPRVLWALLFGNFVIGSGVMVVPGTLNDISTSLAISVPMAGQLISAAALLMCLGAPLLAGVVAAWDRRQLLTGCMLWYGLMHLVCAAMPSFETLLAARVLTVLSPAVFTPQAAACVGALVPPHQRGRAISLVFLGWSVASVLGMPIGSWVGGSLGWRYAFALIALLSCISAAWVWRTMPPGIRPPAFTFDSWRQTFGSRGLMLCVGVTALYSAGQFVLFSYFAPYFKTTLGVGASHISLLFAWFGAFGFLGNLWVSHNIDRLGAARSVTLAVSMMACSLALWPFGASLEGAALIMVPWALGCFAANSAQQARLVGLAPELSSGSIALNTSAMYAGQALGAASGGWLIAHGAMSRLHAVGLAILCLSMLLSGYATHVANRNAPTPTPP